ncbi:conserved exported hypothetical protein [Capnocytophaga canimorsus]|uniref:Lipoprotein n=1 Tax=Capnocytophaga canimorsus TaxID=28188 RepID=A0A0B7IDR4_9FLAO|nr:hypothetical protein [Capnocytophaga canimorsus]CEN48113.1 conserved exported hypothetical protein [Capnocytophaga canimorsus]
MKTFKNLALFLLVAITISCSSPKLGKDRLDLEKFDLNFDVDAFYADEIKKGKENMKELEKLEQKREKEGFSEKARKELVKKAWKLLNFKSIRKDTIFNAQFYEDERSPIAYRYDMWGWNSADSLANYHKMHFHKINMATSLKGDFMALVAQSQGEGTDDFEALLRYLEQKHGKPTVKEDRIFNGFFTYHWELDDRLLAIFSRYDNKENTLKLGVEITENGVKADTAKQPAHITRLFILKNQYKQDSILTHFIRGEWSDFNDLLDGR